MDLVWVQRETGAPKGLVAGWVLEAESRGRKRLQFGYG